MVTINLLYKYKPVFSVLGLNFHCCACPSFIYINLKSPGANGE